MHTLSELIAALDHIGVFQFGRFARDKQTPPHAFQDYLLQTGLIASYPAVLRQTAALMADIFQPIIATHGITHLYCTPGAISLATAVSLHMGLPLTYPSAAEAGHVEGSFDYAIPTLMITNVLSDESVEQAAMHTTLKQGKSAGLVIKALVALISVESDPVHDNLPPVTAIMTLNEVRQATLS